jgi:hypothetical protein
MADSFIKNKNETNIITWCVFSCLSFLDENGIKCNKNDTVYLSYWTFWIQYALF